MLSCEALNMKLVVVLAGLFACSLAASLDKTPKQCKSPPLLTGAFTFSTQNEKVWAYAGYEYDAFQERIRLYEQGQYMNQSFTYNVLLLFKEGVMYEIDGQAKKCTKKPLKADFQPLGVPHNATFVGQFIIGSSSAPGQGLLVNTWGGKTQEGGQYMVTVTEYGCIPVSTLYKTTEYGWVLVSYINNIMGIVDPSALNPPPFCPPLEVKPEGEPVDLFTFIINNKKLFNSFENN